MRRWGKKPNLSHHKFPETLWNVFLPLWSSQSVCPSAFYWNEWIFRFRRVINKQCPVKRTLEKWQLLIAVFVIEQERPRTVGFLKKKIHQTQNPPSALSWLCFHKNQWVQKSLRTELCHEKAVWKTSPHGTCWVSERCVVAEGMHKVQMGREGILSLVLWISNFCSKQRMQGFAKDIKLCQLLYR